MPKLDPLVSPDGKRTWTPETPAQRVDLVAKGWKPAEKQAPKPAAKSEK